jgi:hypothetical protein
MIKYLATLGVSIKNLMRERERNVEQVCVEICFFWRFLIFRLDNENYGSQFHNKFYFLVN